MYASHGFPDVDANVETAFDPDGSTRVRIEVDRTTACLLGMLTHRVSGGELFCQLILSASELDDTRKPAPYAQGPRRIRFSLIGVRA